MPDLVKLNDEVLTSDFFFRYLRYHGDYMDLMDRLLSDRATVQAGRRDGIDASDDEVQQRIDQIRRVNGLHRAKDAIGYIEEFDAIGGARSGMNSGSMREGIVYSFHAFRDILTAHEHTETAKETGEEEDVSTL